MRATFDIISEPVEETYRQLLANCVTYSSTILLVVREPSLLSDSARTFLEGVEMHLLSKGNQSEWPGTVLVGHTADVYRYRLHPEVLLKLQTAARRLYQWVQPDLPEDLCLVRSDGSPTLVTIAHERDGYLTVTEAEAENLLVAIPHLKLSKRR